jgi:cytoskeletal protein CcmA (bactofilin family)
MLGKAASFLGDLVFSGGMKLDGYVKGSVIAKVEDQSVLVVSESATIEGEVRVAHLILNGTVIGSVHANKLLELHPHAKIIGDVRYAALEMHQGAIVDGSLSPWQEKVTLLLDETRTRKSCGMPS